VNANDIFDLFKYMSQSPIGRETVWDYIRENYDNLYNKYGADDTRLGDLLINCVTSFENEFMFSEVNSFSFIKSYSCIN
jgi:glutamyl aminopeptidase